MCSIYCMLLWHVIMITFYGMRDDDDGEWCVHFGWWLFIDIPEGDIIDIVLMMKPITWYILTIWWWYRVHSMCLFIVLHLYMLWYDTTDVLMFAFLILIGELLIVLSYSFCSTLFYFCSVGYFLVHCKVYCYCSSTFPAFGVIIDDLPAIYDELILIRCWCTDVYADDLQWWWRVLWCSDDVLTDTFDAMMIPFYVVVLRCDDWYGIAWWWCIDDVHTDTVILFAILMRLLMIHWYRSVLRGILVLSWWTFDVAVLCYSTMK